MLWMLPKNEEKFSDILTLYRERGVKHVLADFFPDEWADEAYGDNAKWFYDHWLFWPGEWRISPYNPSPATASNPARILFPKEIPEKWMGISCLSAFYSMTDSISDEISFYEETESLNPSASVVVIGLFDSCAFLQMLRCIGKQVLDIEGVLSPFLNFLFDSNIISLKEVVSLKDLFRSISGKKYHLTSLSKKVLDLLTIGYFASMKEYLDENVTNSNSLSLLHKCYNVPVFDSLYGRPWSRYRIDEGFRPIVGSWVEDRKARRCFHSVYPILKEIDPDEAEKYFQEFVLGILIQDHQDLGIQATFRTAYLTYDNWLETCEKAISSIRSRYPKRGEHLLEFLMHFIRKSLLRKELGIHSDERLLLLCENLSRQTKRCECAALIAAERLQWRFAEDTLNAASKDKFDVLWVEMALIAFAQKDFERANEYFSRLSAVALNPFNWQRLATIALVDGIDSATKEIGKVYLLCPQAKGWASAVAYNLFYYFPDEFLTPYGKGWEEAPWRLLLDLGSVNDFKLYK